LTSCEKEVDFTGQLPDAKIVVNCFVEAGLPITAGVSRSWNIAENRGYGYGRYPLPDAEVSLYINDEIQPPMQPYTPPYESQPTWTHSSPSIAREGDIIRMEVRQAGFPDVSAETTVPGKATILSIDTARFKDENSSVAMRFLIKFKDLEAGTKNYYRLIAECEYSSDSIIWTPDPYSGSFINSGNFNYDQDAALSEGFKNATDELLDTETENIYGIFTDELFDGKEYTLNISMGSLYQYYVGETDQMTQRRYLFKLVTLSPSAYMYLKSRTFYDYNGEGDFFTEPSVIYNNIQGGLGILGAFQTDSLRIYMPAQ
jgi:hypothetical protein